MQLIEGPPARLRLLGVDVCGLERRTLLAKQLEVLASLTAPRSDGRGSTVVQHDGRLSPKHAALAWLYDSRRRTKLTTVDDGR